ncbi:3'-5' exonuclease [Paraphaeosphaeria minitans]|uniref:3'-5' exonuclease n=1 Tax=Paraphaeosphaeria minitans TaxID=565426 RepID=A0A9P6KM06_9PLEO|nr:3'-5' exonuclease [Paraphaeosphaeria minitans]
MTTAVVVSTVTHLAQVLDRLTLKSTVPPHLYIDIEGINLSRNGTMSIFTLFDRTSKLVYLIDVRYLGFAAFTTHSATCKTFKDSAFQVAGADTAPRYVTLKTILECPKIPKVFFDVRNDSDALFSHFGIRLDGVQDLQAMELATRSGRNRECVNGLARCLRFGLVGILTPLQRSQIDTIKNRGSELFDPDKGGSFEVFNQRPLDPVIEKYCMQDVIFLPHLWLRYNKKLWVPFWKFVVASETKKRLEESRSAGYIPQDKKKALGWTWDDLRQQEMKWNSGSS